MAPPPPYRALLRSALLTAGASLLALGIAHMAFITWAADRSEDASLLLRLGRMLGAPMLVGAIPAAIAGAIGAYAWQRTWGTPLARSAWGLLVGAAALPVGATLTVFVQAEALAGWVLPFVLSFLSVFAASGWVMARLVAREQGSSPGAPVG